MNTVFALFFIRDRSKNCLFENDGATPCLNRLVQKLAVAHSLTYNLIKTIEGFYFTEDSEDC